MSFTGPWWRPICRWFVEGPFSFTAVSYTPLFKINSVGTRGVNSSPQNMMTSSTGNIFCVTGLLCGEFTGYWWIPRTKASDAEFDVFFDICLNKRMNKQWWGWWFETPSCPLWRHCNVEINSVRTRGVNSSPQNRNNFSWTWFTRDLGVNK